MPLECLLLQLHLLSVTLLLGKGIGSGKEYRHLRGTIRTIRLCHIFFPNPLLADVTNFTRYPYQMSGSTSLFPGPSSGTATCVGQCVDPSKSLPPFVVKFLNSQIKVCTGCKGPPPKGTSGDVLPPPHILCIMQRLSLLSILILKRKIGRLAMHTIM